MFGFGFSEIFLIFLIILILFGAKKIPALGTGLGDGIKNFTKSFRGGDKEEDNDKTVIQDDAAKSEDSRKTEKASGNSN